MPRDVISHALSFTTPNNKYKPKSIRKFTTQAPTLPTESIKPNIQKPANTATKMPPSKTIIFDIIGTLVDHTSFLPALTSRLGPFLKTNNLSVPLFAYAWLEAAQRESAHLISSGVSIPLPTILAGLFPRVLHMAGVSDRGFDEEDVKLVARSYEECEAREGAAECVRILSDAGFDVWAFTDGEREDVLGYFRAGGIEIDNEHVVTCGEIGVKKPVLKAYEKVRGIIGVKDGDEVWLGASHSWDLCGAGRAGLRTAYVKVLEGEEVKEVFGERDVVAETLVGLAQGVVKAARK
jgi:2-haloacid dehalogenase